MQSWNISFWYIIKNRCLECFIMTNILPIEGWFWYFANQRIRHASFDSWSMKVILHQEQCVSLWNILFWHVIKNRCLEYFTMTSILPIEGWFSYFTNQRIRHVSFDSWSMKVILYQEQCVSSWNISFWYVIKKDVLNISQWPTSFLLKDDFHTLRIKGSDMRPLICEVWKSYFIRNNACHREIFHFDMSSKIGVFNISR